MSSASTPAEVAELILASCAAPDESHARRIGEISPANWPLVIDLATSTRTLPLLLRAVERSGADHSIPGASLQQIKEGARWHSINALAQGKALIETLGVLAEHRINPIVLKGAPLCFDTFPDPQLRPLRDVDLLLSPDEAQAAHALLLGNEAFERHENAGQYGLERGHQLPELVHVDSGLVIELHHRINARGWAQESTLLKDMRANARPLQVFGTTMQVPDPEDNFFHLVEHATLHHLFENGPLVLADLHFLATRNALDWTSIASRAERLGLTPALALLTRLAKRYGATWMPPAISLSHKVTEQHLKAAESALIADIDAVARQTMLTRLAERSGGRTGWFAATKRALKPSRYTLSQVSGFSPASPLRWLGYPRWLAQKAMVYLSAASSADDRAEAGQRLALAQWLRAQ